ncbi:MAG TPA: outer membrane protein assembly factor BamB [Burkholderiaceae bacterium]
MRRWFAFAFALVLAGCGSDKPKPTPLEAITPQIAGRPVWSARLEGAAPGLIVAARDGEFTVAGADGSVVALQADTGREVWRGTAGARLTAGVGSDGRYAAVVTRDNEVVVLERGEVRWRSRLTSRVSTAPLVAGERVFVMGVDRVVQAFDALDGRLLWTLQRPGEPLTLSQPGVVAAFKDTLLVGQGQRLTGIDPLRGTVRWEVALANPRGTNEVERLSDLTGPALRIGDMVCARSFQVGVGCANAQLASLLWTRNVGGVQAIGGDADLVVGADASDRITAWRANNGDLAWDNENLRYRGLSGPLVVGRTVIFGDVEGQVHFLDRADGKTLLRLPTDGSPVVGVPVRAGNTILVVTRKGGLFAFRPE